MIEKLKYLLFTLVSVSVGCVVGWLFIYATPFCAFAVATAYTVFALFLKDALNL